MAFWHLLLFPVCAAEAPVATAQRMGGVQVWPCHGIAVITVQKLQCEKCSKDSPEGVETPPMPLGGAAWPPRAAAFLRPV